MTADRYIVVKGTAGMGNRLCAALSGMLYARLANRRICVDWNDPTYSNRGENSFPLFFQGRLRDCVAPLPETDSVAPAIWKGRLHLTAGEMVRLFDGDRILDPSVWFGTSINPGRLDYGARIVVMWTYHEAIYRLRRHLRGPFASLRRLSTDDILRLLLREELELHPELRARVKAFASEYFHGPVVGVHARYSDKRAPLDRIRSRLRTLLAQAPEFRLFLCTDSSAVLEDFRREFPDLCATPKWYPQPEWPMHRWSDCPDRVEMGRSALVDLYLLAACDYLVGDEDSTFAYWARLLSGAKPDRVMNVNRRFKPHPRLRHVVWATRTRLKRLLRMKRSPHRLKPAAAQSRHDNA